MEMTFVVIVNFFRQRLSIAHTTTVENVSTPPVFVRDCSGTYTLFFGRRRCQEGIRAGVHEMSMLILGDMRVVSVSFVVGFDG